MKTHNKKNQLAIMLLCVALFTTLPGSFNGMACRQDSAVKQPDSREAVIRVEKKVMLPVMNPLQILSSKFL